MNFNCPQSNKCPDPANPYLHATGNCHPNMSIDNNVNNWQYCNMPACPSGGAKDACNSVAQVICGILTREVPVLDYKPITKSNALQYLQDYAKRIKQFVDAGQCKEYAEKILCNYGSNYTSCPQSNKCPDAANPYLHSNGNCYQNMSSDRNVNSWQYCNNPCSTEQNDACLTTRRLLCSIFLNFPIVGGKAISDPPISILSDSVNAYDNLVKYNGQVRSIADDLLKQSICSYTDDKGFDLCHRKFR